MPQMSDYWNMTSIVLPVHNAEKWLDECLQSVHEQTFTGSLQLSIYNDANKDSSSEVIERWKQKLESRHITVIIGGHHSASPKGVGFAKNRAVEQSSGQFLCFLDADDIMHKDRIYKQYEAAKGNLNAIVGCRFHRLPEGSTERFTMWANRISLEQLYTQAYTSHGPTLIMPSWFCSRRVLEAVGGFDEGGKGVPEDLIFFYKHLENGGCLFRVDEDLLTYRYHTDAATFSVLEETIWKLRAEFLETQVLDKWTNFTIWNAGKQGRKLYRTLSQVTQFCDVDEKKIKKGVYVYEESQERPKPRIPILHYKHSNPPYIICVKLDLTGGSFEENLQSLNVKEGRDYFHFN